MTQKVGQNDSDSSPNAQYGGSYVAYTLINTQLRSHYSCLAIHCYTVKFVLFVYLFLE